MIFLHIHSESDSDKLKELEKYIKEGKHVFMLIFMQGCGPCGATRPEWEKIEHSELLKSYKNNDNIVIADVDHVFLPKLSHVMKTDDIQGFPTMRYLKGTHHSEDYESSTIPEKNRKLNSFVDWIKSKTMILKEEKESEMHNSSHRKTQKGGRRKRRVTFKKMKKQKRRHTRKI